MVCFKKILAIALAAAAIGTCSFTAVPVSAATASYTIADEVANDSYSVVFKEPYTKAFTFSKQAADGKFQAVTLSAFDKFTVAVRKTSNFAATDTITVAKSTSATGTFTTFRTIKCTAATSTVFTLSQKKGTTAYYSMEVKNKKGTVLYAQRYKVTMADDEIGNNKIKVSLTKNTVSHDADSAKTVSLSMATADNKASAFSFVDAYRYTPDKFKLNFSNLPDGATVQIDRQNINFGNQPANVVTKTISSENGAATYEGGVVQEGNVENITITVFDIDGTAIARSHFTAKGLYKSAEVQTYLYYDYNQNAMSLRTRSNKIYESSIAADDANATNTINASSSEVVNTRFIPLIIKKTGGSYLDSEKIDILYKGSGDNKFTLYQTLSAVSQDTYKCTVALPKVGTTYTIRVLTHLNSGKTLTQDFTDIKPMANSLLNINESWYDGKSGEKVTNQSNAVRCKENDVMASMPIEVSAFEVGAKTISYGIDNRNNSYQLYLASLSDPTDKIVVKVIQNNTTKTVYTGLGARPAVTLNLAQLGITPTLDGVAHIEVSLVNKSGKVLSSWERQLTFVGAAFFNCSLKLSGNNAEYTSKSVVSVYNKETVKHDTSKMLFDSATKLSIVTTDSPYTSISGGHYQGLPINVDGAIYIRKSGETTKTKLSTIKNWMYNGYDKLTLANIASSCGYLLEDGSKYVVTIEFKNKDTNKICRIDTLTINYIGSIGF